MATIKLNRKNYFYNLDQITKHVGSKDKVCVVLKDNAYGHGLLEIATLANEYGIKKAVVKNIYEAKIIEKLFDEILILAETKYETYSHTFHITINELDDIKKIPENAFIHLKIDTGMHRNGIAQNDIEEAIKGILKHKLVLKGVFTHHRNADSLTCEYFWQKCQFNVIKKQVKSLCEKLSLDIPSFHACNTSALFRTKNFDDDFARVGLAQFGYIETNSIFECPNLKPVLSLYAKKLSTRKIISGQSIGYGGTFTAHKDMDISNYDVGYGDGFFRLNEQHHFTTPDNYKVLGRVSMDNLSLDSCDDEVCIFNDVKSLAKIHQTITYEILTSLSPYIKREIE